MPSTGLVKAKLRTRGATYHVTAGDLRLRATLVFEPPFAEGGACIEMVFLGPSPAPTCKPNSAATAITCR